MYYYGNQVFFSEEEQQKLDKRRVEHHVERVDRAIWDDAKKNRDEFMRTEAFSNLETAMGRTLVRDKRGI